MDDRTQATHEPARLRAVVTLLERLRERNLHIVWWGGWPWQWRFYLVRRSNWEPFGELLAGPVSLVWGLESEAESPNA